MFESHQDANKSLNEEADLALAIEESLQEFEVQFGSVVGDDEDNQDSTLPWNPHDLNSMQ